MNDPVAAGAITKFEKDQINKLVTDESLIPSRFNCGIQPIDGSHAIGFVIKGRDNNFWQVASYDRQSGQATPRKPIWGMVSTESTLAWVIPRSRSLTPILDHDAWREFKEKKSYPSEDITKIVNDISLFNLHKIRRAGARWVIMSKECLHEIIPGGIMFIRFLKNFVGTLPTIQELDEDEDDIDFYSVICEVDSMESINSIGPAEVNSGCIFSYCTSFFA